MKNIKKFISCALIICLVFTSFSFQTIISFAEEELTETEATETEASISEPTEIVQNAFDATDQFTSLLDDAVINGNVLTLNFNKRMDTDSIPSINDFLVKITTNEMGGLTGYGQSGRRYLYRFRRYHIYCHDGYCSDRRNQRI